MYIRVFNYDYYHHGLRGKPDPISRDDLYPQIMVRRDREGNEIHYDLLVKTVAELREEIGVERFVEPLKDGELLVENDQFDGMFWTMLCAFFLILILVSVIFLSVNFIDLSESEEDEKPLLRLLEQENIT